MKAKAFLLLPLLALPLHAQQRAMTIDPNTETYSGNLTIPSSYTLQADGTLRTAQNPVFFGSVWGETWGNSTAKFSFFNDTPGSHGIISRTVGGGGIPIVGLSETGACAGKFVQINQHTSPVVWIGRDANTFNFISPPTTPSLVVSTPADWLGTPVAQFCKNQNEVVLEIGSNGMVTAPQQQFYDSNALITVSHVQSNYMPKFGVTNASEASSGTIGQYLSVSAASQSLTTATAKTVASLTLPAGDWDVSGVVTYTKSATTVVTYTQQGLNTTANTIGDTGTFTSQAAAITDAIPSAFPTPTVRFNHSGTAIVNLVAKAGFTTSTLTATGFIRARRVR